MALKEYWDGFVKFLVDYDIHKLTDTFRQLDWKEVARNPMVWVVGGTLLILMLWRRMIRLMIGIVSLAAFFVLIEYTLPPTGQAIPLDRLLLFIGGSVVLLLLNLYFLFVRE